MHMSWRGMRCAVFLLNKAPGGIGNNTSQQQQRVAQLSVTGCTREAEGPPVPVYQPRVGEDAECKRARLLYQSRKRGMLENGLLLSTFADRFLKTFTPDQLDRYDNLINRPSNDWQIYYWVTGKEETPLEYDNDIMAMLKQHTSNPDKQIRCSQPPL